METRYDERILSVGITIEACTLGLISLFVSLAFFAFNVRLRSNRLIKMSSPILNLFIACGGILLSACCALYGLDYFLKDFSEAASIVCQTRVGLLACGSSLLFGPMFLKSWRVYRLFHNAGKKRLIIKDSRLLLLTGALLVADLLLLAVWRITDPLVFRPVLTYRQTEDEGEESDNTPGQWRNGSMAALTLTRFHSCSSAYFPFWLTAFLLLKMALLCYGLFLSWQTRVIALPSLNESRCIVVSALTTVALTTLTVAVSHALEESRDAVYACVVLSVWLCTMVTLCAAFLPKVSLWWRNPEAKGMRVSVTSTLSSSPLFPLQQLEEELSQAAAENDALRKSLEEKDVSIRKLQQHLTNAYKRLSSLGLSLELIQDSGLDLDFSSSDSDNAADPSDPHLLMSFTSTDSNSQALASSGARNDSPVMAETTLGSTSSAGYQRERTASSACSEYGELPSTRDNVTVGSHGGKATSVGCHDRGENCVDQGKGKVLSNFSAARAVPRLHSANSSHVHGLERRSPLDSNSSGGSPVPLLTDTAKMAALGHTMQGNMASEQGETFVFPMSHSGQFPGRRRNKRGYKNTRRQSSQSDAIVLPSSKRRQSDQSETIYLHSARRQSAQSEAVIRQSACRRSSQSESVFTSPRRGSLFSDSQGRFLSTRPDNCCSEGQGRLLSTRQDSCSPDSQSRPLSPRRGSCFADPGRSSSRRSSSDTGNKRRRRQNQRRHSANSVEKLSKLRQAIAQDLQHARSLSNVLSNSVSKELDNIYRRRSHRLRRRSSSTKSREDLAESIVGSYGLEDSSDTYSFVSSFLAVPSVFSSRGDRPASLGEASVLDNDALYPEIRHKGDMTSLHEVERGQGRSQRENGRRLNTCAPSSNNHSNLHPDVPDSRRSPDRHVLHHQPPSTRGGLVSPGMEPPTSLQVYQQDQRLLGLGDAQNAALKDAPERASRAGGPQEVRSSLDTQHKTRDEQQDIFSVQMARRPQFVQAGYAQTRALYSVDTFI